MRMILPLFAGLCLTGCASAPPIVTIPPAACADMVPPEWANGVEAAPIPQDAPVTFGVPLTPQIAAAIVAPWATAYVAMSGALEKANGRTRDAIAIQRQCEKMVNAARPEGR